MNIAYSTFDKITNAWTLMCDAWIFLKKDKEILVFPALAFTIILGSALLCGNWLTTDVVPLQENVPLDLKIFYYGKLFIGYFFISFIITLFNSATVACALIRIRGEDPKLSDGFKVMLARFPQIFAWSIMEATVGVLFRIIEDRSKSAGKLIGKILNFVWSYVTRLIVPVLVIEGKGPFSSLKMSASLLKKTWGEQLVADFSFEIIYIIACLPMWLILLLVYMMSGLSISAAVLAAVAWVILVSVVISTLTSIFEAALYEFTVTKKAPVEFNEDTFQNSMGLIEYGPLRTREC